MGNTSGYQSSQSPDGNYKNLQSPADGYDDSQNPSSSYAGSNDSSDNYSSSQNPPSAYLNKNDTTVASVPANALFGNGVNLQPSYSNGGDCDLGWSLMTAKSNIKTVRLEIEPGTEQFAQRWIKEASDNGYKIIATYHHAAGGLGKDNNEIYEAAKWWSKNYNTLNGNGDFFINLINEWGSHYILADAFATAYNSAIQTIRAFYDGPIIVDAPGYGQNIETMIQAIKGTGPNKTKIADENIIPSLHIYADANDGYSKPITPKLLDSLNASGRSCIIGEFGDNNKDVITNVDSVIDYAKNLGWPVIGWAWGGDDFYGQTNANSNNGKVDPKLNMNMIESTTSTTNSSFDKYIQGTPAQYTYTNYFNTIYNKL